ncbi:Fibulin-2 [Bulinus truncatus]|nr:Fibulin-2 [Bulinus truncatus]
MLEMKSPHHTLNYLVSLGMVMVCNRMFCSLGVPRYGCGQFYEIFGKCCHDGVQWAGTGARCDSYPAPVLNISDNYQAACLSILEVCCLKQSHLAACEDGKVTALDGQICAIRDSDPGAEKFRECCHCCQLGLIARNSEPACVSPTLGEPCDTKYRECCQGETKQNETGLTKLDLALNTLNNDGAFRENASASDETRSDAEILEIDVCASPLNNCSHLCVNSKTSFVCMCPSGYQIDQSDNRTCRPADVNYQKDFLNCALNNNPCEQRCIDRKNGTVECRCYEGYILSPDGISCQDIDECVERLATCSSGEMCINIRGSYTCSAQCPASFVLNPKTGFCEQDIQQCHPGFIFNFDMKKCEDLNECGIGIDSCGIGERCENTVGSYVCRRERNCGTGYTLDEKTQKCIGMCKGC